MALREPEVFVLADRALALASTAPVAVSMTESETPADRPFTSGTLTDIAAAYSRLACVIATGWQAIVAARVSPGIRSIHESHMPTRLAVRKALGAFETSQPGMSFGPEPCRLNCRKVVLLQWTRRIPTGRPGAPGRAGGGRGAQLGGYLGYAVFC